jgi:peptidoglycan hydrolase CwlO-like protein
MEKFKNFLKDTWEWIVAIGLFVSGYFIWSYFFKKSNAEKKILSDIKSNDAEISELEKLAYGLDKKEKDLHKNEQMITEKIEQKEKDISEKDKVIQEKKEKIEKESKNIDSAIDYLNKKY